MKKKVSNNSVTDNASKSLEKVKPVKKKKEATKSREWERDRRERLNSSFTTLSNLLPTSNNVHPTKKMEILQKASSYITALQQENTELLQSGGLEKSWSREVKQLQCQVKELTSRIQQLASLLQEAGGKLPPWVSLPANQQIPPPLGKRQFLYSNKITQESVEKHLAEPKHKKSKKSVPKEKGSPEAKKKKTKSPPKKKTENVASNPIKPPSVAQLLNSNSNKNDESASTSGLVILPPEKPASSIDLSSGILVLKGNSQTNATPSTKNNLTSGLLIVHTPAAPTPSLTAGACLLLSSNNAVTTQQTSAVTTRASIQNPVFGSITGQQSQQAETTTLLSAPIMATGQPSSNSTFVVTNGNFLPVLSKPSGAKKLPNLKSKLKQEIENGTKVAIPKLPKVNTKTIKKPLPKKKKSKTSDVDLHPLQSIDTTPSNNDVTPKDSTDTTLKETADSNAKEAISAEKEIAKESKENQVIEKEKPPSESPKKVVETISEDSKSSAKPMSKSSYSIDALCRGKAAPVIDEPLASQSAVITDHKKETSEGKEKQTENITKELKTVEDKDKESDVEKKPQNLNKSSCVTEKPKELPPKKGEIVNNENKENKKIENVESSFAEAGQSISYSDSINRNYFTGFEPCIRADFVAAEISPSGFIGPQPPMATVVDAPLTKETLESFTSNTEEDETCRAENQESEVPSTFSSDLFASLNVPSGHPESISPTAAFLLAFPLVSSSSGRANEIDQNEMPRAESCSSNNLLQLGTMDDNQPAVVELMHHRHHSAMQDAQNRHTLQESQNIPPGNSSVYKSPSKPLLSNMLPPCSNKHHEINSKHYNPYAMIQHNFLGSDQQVNDYDAEISSIMSSNNQVILPVTTSETKISSQRTVTSNSSSCRIKATEKSNQYVRNQTQNLSEKQFVPVANQNVCSQKNLCAEPQLRDLGSQIPQQQQPLYRPCNSNKKQIPPQPNNYHQNDNYSNPLQNSNNSSCSVASYKQPIFSAATTPSIKPLAEVCGQKIVTENDQSHFIGKLHGKTNNSDQHYKLPQTESGKIHATKPTENEQRFERRNENVSRHNSLVTTASGQAYAYNLFSDYPPSNYVPPTSSSYVPVPPTSSSYVPVPSSMKSSYNSATNYVPPPITTLSNYAPVPPPVSTSVTSYIPPPSTATCSSLPNYVPLSSSIKSSSNTSSNYVPPPITTASSSVPNYVPIPVSSSVSNYVTAPPITTSSNSIRNYVPVPPITCSSNYVSLSSSITSTVSSVTTESSTSSSFGSFSVAHNSSNFGILSWSTMSAPNTAQHYPATECHKPSYQHSNETSNKLPPFQQPNNNRISYPPQVNKEANNRIPYTPQLNKETTPRPLVNWMTAPDVRHENMPTQNTFDHTQVPSEILQKDNCAGTNFSNNTIYSEFSENLGHSAWQGGNNKSQPLPTLIGDLALGPTPPSRKYCSGYKQPPPACTNYKQPASKQDNKDKRGDYGAPSTFLSVSQLVESNIKEPRTSRKANRPSSKAVNRKDRNNKNNQFNEPVATTYPAISNWPAPKPSYKTAPSNYSAESLIAIPTQQEMLSVDKSNTIERYSQNYTSRNHFATESTTTNYFTESIEPNYQQYSSNPSNYQSNNYSNQTFPPTEIPSSTLPSFSTELGSSNFLFPTTTASTRPSFFPSQVSNTNKSSRSNKRRHNAEDNYHYNNFGLVQDNTGRSQQARCNEVPSSQPTYHSARTSGGVQTPSNSGTGASSSLTNFNLSTIFPEINDKAPLPPLPAFVSSKNLSTSAPLISGSSADYMLHPSNMGFNNLLNPPHQVGIGLNQSFPTPNFSMPPSLSFSVHEH